MYTRASRVLGSEKYLGKDLEDVKKTLLRREQDEVEIGKRLFNGIDYRNHNGHHLVINSGKLSVDQEVEVIMALMGL